MSKLDKDQVLSAFTEAYTKANGKEPQIEVKSGWYSIDGGKNVRLVTIEEMTAALTGGEIAPAEPVAETKPAKAPKAKKASAKAATTEVKSKGYSVVKVGEGFNPANFWLDYLSKLGSDCRTPHGFY
ncbi:hypothetical protein KO525_03650 [Psychrosphaera sp. B3R10]|uniref:Uncharacterized protein n=1 Tax=Psychrosphaera algicola TaxID=3023714 RepID=A0ABT5F914_9GAMM|nr:MULTISPECIES: hypothetical protein [unclassified Psychrosphaera]MBU2881372.1 hypothetical protein [Psychrosphaera sp. I2R16]MBU2988471.1 hypothetical protein [Psychrosphaera sp. B3R10]MDC2888016.1 hypothetical protein [Psychrosphaera sp. G1-22]MDO6720029.1 hypothetical protein [Psychrosphaera sp. 1_MG-2023]